MSKLIIPDPIVDKRETKLLKDLTDQFEKYTSPGKFAFLSEKAGKLVEVITPEKARKQMHDAIEAATEWDVIQQALIKAGQGMGKLQNITATYTCNRETVIGNIRKANPSLQEFNHICLLRSYDIEKVVQKAGFRNYGIAAVEGAGTGLVGIVGAPVTIVLSLLLYFRMSQLVAMYYGYNPQEDPRELEFASAVTMTALSPNLVDGGENMTALIGKMMLSAEFSALRDALAKNVTYVAMAEAGGAQLLYAQIRALAEANARKAITTTGQKSLEGTMMERMLKELGTRMSKEVGKKAIPLFSAVIGACFDTYYMSRVVNCANMIYHKRFIFEKEERINMVA